MTLSRIGTQDLEGALRASLGLNQAIGKVMARRACRKCGEPEVSVTVDGKTITNMTADRTCQRCFFAPSTPAEPTQAPAIIHTAEEQWLMRRKELVTASEVAMILGAHPTKGPLEVYAEKLGLVEFDETDLMRRGRRFQRPIAEEYAEETGRTVREWPQYEVTTHPEIPWLGATRDFQGNLSEKAPGPSGVSIANPRAIALPVEVKNTNLFMSDKWADEAPVEYQIQLQIQMAVSGQPLGALAALLGGLRFVWADYMFSKAFVDAAVPKLEAFWLCVQRRELPQVDREAMWRSAETVKKLWPTEREGLSIALPLDAIDMVEAWEAAKARKLDAEKEVKAIETQLRLQMTDAAIGMLSDGTSLTLNTTSREGYTVAPTTYRTLRWFTPKGMQKKKAS